MRARNCRQQRGKKNLTASHTAASFVYRTRVPFGAGLGTLSSRLEKALQAGMRCHYCRTGATAGSPSGKSDDSNSDPIAGNAPRAYLSIVGWVPGNIM